MDDNDLVTVEIHLPSASIPDDYHLELKTAKNGGTAVQYLRVNHRLTSAFVDMENFDLQIGDFVSHIKDASIMSKSRKAAIKNLRMKFAEKYDLEKRYVNMVMDVELPFVCEDIFDLKSYHGQY